jgi:hypothetical protein
MSQVKLLLLLAVHKPCWERTPLDKSITWVYLKVVAYETEQIALLSHFSLHTAFLNR